MPAWIEAKGFAREPSPCALPKDDDTKTPTPSVMRHGSSFVCFVMSQPGGAPPSTVGTGEPPSCGLWSVLLSNEFEPHPKKRKDKVVTMDRRMIDTSSAPIGPAQQKLR